MEMYSHLKRLVAIGALAIPGYLSSCGRPITPLEGITDPTQKKEIAAENLRRLLANRGYPSEEITSDRVKTRCGENPETRVTGEEQSFNCEMIVSAEYGCGALEGNLDILLTNGGHCNLVAKNAWIATGDGCSWAREVQENLGAYCGKKF